jgi:hypothetical protein
MVKQELAVRDTDGCEVGLIPKKKRSARISTPAFPLSQHCTNGTTITVVFNEAVVVGVAGLGA